MHSPHLTEVMRALPADGEQMLRRVAQVCIFLEFFVQKKTIRCINGEEKNLKFKLRTASAKNELNSLSVSQIFCFELL